MSDCAVSCEVPCSGDLQGDVRKYVIDYRTPHTPRQVTGGDRKVTLEVRDGGGKEEIERSVGRRDGGKG